jgi:DUF4097 and DUF4098 domain-containing protein YvlB
MRYSRAGIVAVLAAAEIFVAGAILWALGGGSFAVRAAGLPHAYSWQAGKAFSPIDAGNSPHVVVNDPESRFVIEASTDGKVHVVDDTRMSGLFLGGNRPMPLEVSKTGDGVSIVRPESSGGMHVQIFGFSQQRVELQVPQGAYVDVQRCGGADLSDLNGRIAVHSFDGHISAKNVHATQLTLRSEDGSLRLNDVAAPSIDASTQDGSIRASGLAVGGGALRTADGSIRAAFTGSDVTVRARTADGSIYFNGHRAGSDQDGSPAEFLIGKGGGSLEVSTQDGSIHITSNGAQ